MANCREFLLDDTLAVTAIPIGNIPAGSVSSPANQLTATIDRSSITTAMLEESIAIGRDVAGVDGVLIPIIRRTGKAVDEESDSVAGRLHTVNVTCEVDDRDPEVWNHLVALERTPSHLMLTFRGGAQAFVAANQDTYLCRHERDGAKTTVTFKIQNLMGIQLMVEEE